MKQLSILILCLCAGATMAMGTKGPGQPHVAPPVVKPDMGTKPVGQPHVTRPAHFSIRITN